MIITKQVDPVISDLDDLVDDCELKLEPEHAFETRRRIAAARSDAIAYRRFVAPQRAGADRNWPSSTRPGWRRMIGCTCARRPIASRAWPRIWRRCANAPR